MAILHLDMEATLVVLDHTGLHAAEHFGCRYSLLQVAKLLELLSLHTHTLSQTLIK